MNGYLNTIDGDGSRYIGASYTRRLQRVTLYRMRVLYIIIIRH